MRSFGERFFAPVLDTPSYAAPVPAGLEAMPIEPPAYYHRELGEYLLPYNAMRMSADPVYEIGGRDTGDRRLARRIDVHHEQHVRLVEGGQELLTQVQRARVAMRLKDRHHTAVEPRLGGGEGGAELGWMVPVVVHHRDASGRSPHLEAALDAREPGQGPLDGHERDLQIEAHRDGVRSAVPSWSKNSSLAHRSIGSTDRICSN